jgi:predicted N-acetyltransferase YhbS
MSEYIETTLSNSPSYLEETLSLLEDAFKYPSHHKFLTDFYPLLGTHNHNHCHILIKDNKVVGHIGVNKRTISYKGDTLEVILIGAIAIHSSYRGQGVFSKFFKSILKTYKDKASLMFLWSDLTSLYNKFDFYEAGGIIQTGRKTLLKESIASSWIESNFKDISNDHFEQIKNLYNKRADLHVIREEKHWSAIKEISSARLFYKLDKSDNIDSYFILGKGNDLSDIIHEYASSDEQSFLNEFDTYKLWLPERYNSIYHKKDIHFGYFISITNLPKFSSFLFGITDKRLELTGSSKEEYIFKFDDKEFNLEKNAFLTSLFGPNPIKEFEEVFPGLMIHGLDSI